VSFPSDPYTAAGSYPSSDVARTDAFNLTVSQNFAGGVSAKLILGYRKLDAQTSLDVDASALPLADTTLINTSKQKSAELELSNSAGGPVDWVAGLYWFKDDGSAPSVQAPASPEFLAALAAINQATGGTVDLAPFFSPLPVYEQNSVVNRSVAGYAHAEWHLTQQWAIAGGVRHTDDRRDLDENSFVDIPGLGQNCTILDVTLPPPYQITGPCPPIQKSVSYGFWSWELSSHYRFTPAVSGYVRIGRSQRSGGWNAPLSTVQDLPFRPEQLTDYEVGVKADLLGGALAVKSDVFYDDYDDMQRLLAHLNPDGTPVTQVINAGRARLSGFEFETAWRVVPHATLQASFGYIDARYVTFEYTPIPGGPSQDLSHNDFYQTPRLQASLGGSYEVPMSAGDLRLYADYAWQDKVQFNVVNDFNNQPSYATTNARVSYTSRTQGWELAAFANNLTNQRYAYTGGTLAAPFAPSPTIAWHIPGEPRTYGVEATYRWKSAN
jgi:iron complex outermembrane receptor protein